MVPMRSRIPAWSQPVPPPPAVRRSSVRSWVARLAVLASLANCAGPDDWIRVRRATAGGPSPDVREVAATYRALRPMTEEPVLVEPALALLCRGATSADLALAREVAGPHALTTVRIYMNEVAAEAFGARGIESPGAPSGGHDGVGGMIKRAPGYDPANGDWEYFYFEDASAVESGRIASCIACHRGSADRDFVFGDWARESARKMHGG